MRTEYRILVVKPEGKRPLGRPGRRWEDNIEGIEDIKGILRKLGGRVWIGFMCLRIGTSGGGVL
jgi:hypothetical protein